MAKRFIWACVGLLAFAVAACAPASSGPSVDTAVAATLQAQVAPTDTQQPIDGEIQAQSVYGDCANTGQVQLAYLKEGNLWLWVQGEAPRQLTHEADAVDVRISDDGCRLAYARALPNPGFDPTQDFPQPQTYLELWVLNSDGSGQHALAGQSLFNTLPVHQGSLVELHQFDWQPGSRRLAFSTRHSFSGPGLLTNGDLYLVDADLSVPELLLPAGQAGRFVFSPDGAQLAYASANRIGVVSVDDAAAQAGLLSFPPVLTYSEYQYEPPLVWTPDGDLIFALPPEDMFAIDPNGALLETSLWYLPLDGSEAFQAGAVQTVEFILQEVAFSPDASRIAYLRPTGDPLGAGRELVIALSNGSQESAWFDLPEVVFGAWSPDNQRFLYAYQDGGLQVRLDDVASGTSLPVEAPGLADAPAVDLHWLTQDLVLLALRGPEAQLFLWTRQGGAEFLDSVGFGSAMFDAPPAAN